MCVWKERMSKTDKTCAYAFLTHEHACVCECVWETSMISDFLSSIICSLRELKIFFSLFKDFRKINKTHPKHTNILYKHFFYQERAFVLRVGDGKKLPFQPFSPCVHTHTHTHTYIYMYIYIYIYISYGFRLHQATSSGLALFPFSITSRVMGLLKRADKLGNIFLNIITLVLIFTYYYIPTTSFLFLLLIIIILLTSFSHQS